MLESATDPRFSNSDNSEDEPKVLPALRKRIVIISTDTTVVADTTHVKHRTREKRKITLILLF